MVNQIFINFPVKNLNDTVDFFTQLGFTFDPKFTNKDGTCMMIGENMFAMFLVEKFFKTFINKEVSDAKKTTEVILAISLVSKKEVDEMVEKVIKAGGKEHRLQDYGWMYSRSFEDLDGHIWEPFFMDEKNMPKE